MEVLKILSGPILGAFIGFGTNYLAIKMLFHPYKKIKIAGIALPFTPGIIPKRKSQIAKSVGEVVGNELFTKKDIQNFLLSEQIPKKLSDNFVHSLKNNDNNIKENLAFLVNEERYMLLKDKVKDIITLKLQNAILDIDLGEVITKEAELIVKEKVTNPLIKMFLSDNLISSFSVSIANNIENFIQKDGRDIIGNIIENEINNLENTKISTIFEKTSLDEDKMYMLVSKIYKNLIIEESDKFLEGFNIAEIVEEKINNMDLYELEKMILKIMKKELNAVVSLGGILGFLIGLFNILVVL